MEKKRFLIMYIGKHKVKSNSITAGLLSAFNMPTCADFPKSASHLGPIQQVFLEKLNLSNGSAKLTASLYSSTDSLSDVHLLL